MSYEINVMVNGSRCKQYNHDGKTFIEAKKGSEYTIEIKNNTWQRVLAVCSVDGLDILNGKPAVENGPGYVISGYNTGRFDGFRVSNETVAKFIFDYKNSSYAASKEDGSEKNVGVIGVRIFQEKVKPPTIIKEIHHHHDHWHDYWWNRYPYYDRPSTIWCDGLTKDSDITNSWDDRLYSRNSSDMGEIKSSIDNCIDNSSHTLGGGLTYSCNNAPTKGLSNRTEKLMSKKASAIKPQSLKLGFCDNPRGFDMGTKFGEAKESRVIEVEFEKGILAITTNIYYASRQSLIEMGVPLGSEKQVNFPEPFVDSKYAKPPEGWTK